MPKLKTRKSVAKRMKVTKKKKVLRGKAGRRHLLSHKKTKRKRVLGKKTLVKREGDQKSAKRAMPYA